MFIITSILFQYKYTFKKNKLPYFSINIWELRVDFFADDRPPFAGHSCHLRNSKSSVTVRLCQMLSYLKSGRYVSKER